LSKVMLSKLIEVRRAGPLLDAETWMQPKPMSRKSRNSTSM
jgi:hypothetical protein